MLTGLSLARAIMRTMGSSSITGPPVDPWIGLRVVDYRVTRLIGQGGMGAVYEARHETLRQRAALKVLRLDQAAGELAKVRFVREAKAASSVRHDNLIEIFNYGHLDEKSPYILMEFLEGESLKERLTRHHCAGQRLPLSQVVEIGVKVASVLSELHRNGIIHRDLKPANLMLVPWPGEPSGERIKLVDFGIAKLADENTEVMKTTIGRFVGTAAYASPEQCQMSPDIGPASDVYSLGITLYQLLAGQPPFWHNLPGLLLAMHQLYKPPALRPRAPQAPLDLCRLVERMLEKDPLARPSMEHVADALGFFRRQPVARTRNVAAVKWLTAAVPLLVLAGGAGIWFGTRPPPHPSVHPREQHGAQLEPTAQALLSNRPTVTGASPTPPASSHAVESVVQPPGPSVQLSQRLPSAAQKDVHAQALPPGAHRSAGIRRATVAQPKPSATVATPAAVATAREPAARPMAARGPDARKADGPPPPLVGPD